MNATNLTIALGDDDVQRIAVALAAHLRAAASSSGPARDLSAGAPLTLDETAKYLRCSTRKIRRDIAKGLIRAIKMGQGGSSRLLIARSEIERLLQQGG